MTKCLFVGGDYNGELIDVEGLPPELRMPLPRSVGASSSITRQTEAFFHYASYKRESFVDRDGLVYYVYMHGDVARPVKLLIQSFSEMAEKLK